MSVWIRNSLIGKHADTYEEVRSTGAALTRDFDLSSLPESNESDALVVQRLAQAETRGGVVYHGVPPRLFEVPEDQRPVGPTIVERFLSHGAPSIS